MKVTQTQLTAFNAAARDLEGAVNRVIGFEPELSPDIFTVHVLNVDDRPCACTFRDLGDGHVHLTGFEYCD